ncbi:MAG: ATP-dependent RecD-like DNA helicase [Chloroflexi bacterium]|nr:ATP-dependent RecD-like DNA helicase [Chloroflexota bacterium]
MSDSLTGVVERTTFYNPANGYSVVKITPDKKMPGVAARDGTVTVVGTLPELAPGEPVEFTGLWIEDAKYGKQFRAETFSPSQPRSLDGIRRYLASGIVKGIGEATADKIVKHFGEDTITILNADPDRLRDVHGLKASLADKLAKAWAENAGVRQTMIFLQDFGVSSKMAKRIFDHYGVAAIETVKQNPYVLADEVFGIGFIRADQLARAMGIKPDAPERIRAGLAYALNQLSGEGHTCAPHDVLVKEALKLLSLESGLENLVEQAIGEQTFRGDLISETLDFNGEPVEMIYLPRFHTAETKAAKRLRAVYKTTSPIQLKHKKTDWDKLLKKLSTRDRIGLSDQQKGAVIAALTSKLSVLTGGPGTGKTTTLKMVLEALDEGDFEVALASPTGRAAKRLSEATGRQAYTVHRLLGYGGEGFAYDDSAPLEADFVIVDEASMLDVQLLFALTRALKPEAHLLLVGDIDQLPSVGPGNVLRDMIESGLAHVTRLEVIFRQDEGSHIVLNAHRINNGDAPFMDNRSNDFFFFVDTDATGAAELLVDVVINRLPAKFGVDPLDTVQVIAPMYRGPAGVDSLNMVLQRALNGNPALASKRFGDRTYRTGDKVMQTRNNYEKDVYNGDIGRISGFDFEESTMEVVFDGRYVIYEFHEVIEELTLAYCISTHKSQGSEYPIVVMPVVKQHYMMLQRNLLYTAITRARQAVVLVGDKQAVYMAVSNSKVTRRYGGLLHFLTA